MGSDHKSKDVYWQPTIWRILGSMMICLSEIWLLAMDVGEILRVLRRARVAKPRYIRGKTRQDKDYKPDGVKFSREVLRHRTFWNSCLAFSLKFCFSGICSRRTGLSSYITQLRRVLIRWRQGCHSILSCRQTYL